MEGLRTYTGVERAAVLMMLVGEDEAAAMEAVVGLFERRFDEDS